MVVNGKREVDLQIVYPPNAKDVVTIFEDGSVVVSFKVMDMFTGNPIEGLNVKLNVNETSYNNVSASGGIVSFTLSGFPLGSYDCVAQVDDDTVVTDTNIPFVLKVISKDLTYTPEDYSIDNIKIPYGGNMDWNVVDSADNAINGEVKITSGDFSTTANITDGKFNSDLKGLDAGSHEVTFSVENYNDKVFNIEIVPADTVTVLTIPKTSVIDGTVEFKAKVNVTTGKITFYLDNLELTSKDVDENGEASYQFTISTLGSIKISANYTDSNGNYNPSNDSGVIDVTKKPYQIYGNQVIYYGEKFDRIVNDGGMITGDFTLKNDTFETTLHADNGILTFDLSKVDVGTYTFNLTSEKYEDKEITITINPVASKTTLTGPTNINVGEDQSLTAQVNATSGQVAFYVNDVLNQTVDLNGENTTTFDLSSLPAGNYTISANYSNPKGNYKESSASMKVTVSLIDASVSAEDITLDVGENATIAVTTTPEGLEVTYTPDNSGVVTVEDGVVTGVKEGSANVTITIVGNGKYYENSTTITVTVKKIGTKITVANETVSLKVEEEIDSGASLDPTDAGTLNYTSSNSSVVKVEDGKLIAVGEGTANVTVSFDGDDKYNAAESKTIEVTVILNEASVSAEDITLDVGANDTIDVNTTPEGLEVTYTPDNSGVVTVEDGVVTGVKEGSANVTITIVGNGKYYENSTTITVTVKKIDTAISVNDKVDMKVDDSIDVNATLTPADAGDLTYKSDNEAVVKVEDGKLIAVGVGDATVTVSFDGNEKYNKAESKTIDVTVRLIDASVSAEDITLNVGATATINATTTPEGLTIDYVVDNSGVVTVENGVVTAVKAGTATITLNVGDDEVYAKNSTTITVTVNKIDTSIDVENKSLEIYVDYEGRIVATLNPDGGDVNFTSSDESIITVYNFGEFKANAEGTATITVSFAGDDKYNAAEDVTVTVKVSKIDTSIEFNYDPINLTVNNETIVIATLKPAEAGNVTYASSNTSVVTVDSEGNVIAVGAGNATITASFKGNDKYNEAESVSVPVTVSKIDTKITVDTESLDLKIGNETAVKGTLIPSEAGNVSYMSDNPSVVTVDENTGKVTAVGEGTATIVVYYDGNDDYNMADDVTISVTVSKIDTSISVNDKVDMKVGDSVDANAKLTPADAGTLNYNSNNPSVVKVENGKLVAVGKGTATVTVSYDGDDKYNAAESKTITVTVKKIDTSIEVDKKSLDLKVDDKDAVVASLTPADAGKVTFTSSDDSVVTVDKNGKVTAVGAGSATITASYAGSDKYNAAENVTVAVSVKENKQNASMDVDAGKAVEDENSTITVNLPKDATGNVTAVIEGNPYTAPVVNGTATISVPGLRPGNYTAHVSYSGDDKYKPASKDIPYEVEEVDKSDIISAPDVTKYFGGSERFVVNITDYKGNPVANKSVTIVVNGQSYDRTTKADGTTSIGLALNSGTYNATVTVGNETVNSVVTVLPTVNGTDVVKVYRNATPYYATFRDSEGNYLKEGTVVTFNINGVMYERKISGSEGLAKLNLNLEQGTYVLTAMNPQTGENAANNITIIPRLVENKDITKYYRNATQYTVKVLGDDGNPVGAGETVTFNINGVMYNRQTNESGIAKLNLNLQPDDYIITAEYKNCKVSNKIKILPVLSAKDISMKYRDGTKFVATLVDGQGKPFAGQTIQFNINGVFYNRVTDSAGQAKLNINLQAGKYIITSSYNGANIANTVTIAA